MTERTVDSSSARTRFRFKSRTANIDLDDTAREAHEIQSRRRSHRQDSRSTNPDANRERKRRKTRHSDRAKPKEVGDEFSSFAPFSDPDVAFREALFDAMADDEGAAYWESVYDQPLHIYSNTKSGPNGELERMTDEEYTAYVRAKMYEKTHEHLIAERKRREEMRTKEREQRQWNEQLDNERRSFQVQMEESLQRGERRRAQKLWKEAWDRYLKAWEFLLTCQYEKDGVSRAREIIPWPVKSAQMIDVNRETVESFFRNAPPTSDADGGGSQLLKVERIKWHPDKMQQRFGTERLDEKVLRAVTAVFQVIDTMYNNSRQTAAQNPGTQS